MTQGIGYKSTLAVGSGSGTVIGSIVDGFESEAETEMVDVTLLGDTYKSYMAADTDGGELSFEVALSTADTELVSIQAAQAAGTVLHWTITYSNGGTESFSGLVKSVGRAVKKRELLTRKITVKVSGNPGYAVS